ncbi:MAG: hypothetical protein HWE27_04720 [Gammaproteobacteria bacterium]|nr:hypothetical protein [Gammaproteobacteria bacterium]
MRKYLIVFFMVSFNCLASNAPCDDKVYQQFDFWLGEWEVFSKDGKAVGKNSIKKQHGNCVITEHYESSKNYTGESLNIYDKATKKWNQSWVDNSGLFLALSGNWNGQAMVLRGERSDDNGSKVIHQIKWMPQKNGMVHQEWSVSKDQGQHWETLFYGVYKKLTSD